MSIAVIVDTFPRWSERFIARELNELMRRGVEFSIYCLRAGDPDCDRDPEFADLIALRVVLPSCFLPSAARELGMDAAARARIKKVEDELGVLAFRQIGCANSIAKLLREQGHSLVYAHFASLPSTLGWLAAEALNLPLVISAHARDVFVDGQLLAEKMAYARRVFTCNSRAFEKLQSVELEAGIVGKAVLMPHGLPLEKYPFSEHESKANYRLLAAGRFVTKKGFGDLIEAVALSDRHVSLTLLGEGTERKVLMKKIARLNLGERVSMPGAKQGADLRGYFDAANAFVVPSVDAEDGDSDGVPNVVLEAFALGLPVVGTDAGSLKDVLDASQGFLTRQRNPASLAAAIAAVYLKPERTAECTRNARRFVEERYDIGKNIEPLLAELSM